MPELVIARVPHRSGLYLGVQEGNSFRAIARFMQGERSAREFMDWAIASGVITIDERKGSSMTTPILDPPPGRKDTEPEPEGD